jgi:hypothetical protein
MRALRGGIPRAYANHKTPQGWAYSAYARAKLARLGPLPRDAMPTLREAARVAIELELLGHRQDALRAMRRPRRAELRRLGSEARKMRVQLLLLERRLEEVAANGNGHAKALSPADLLASVRRDRQPP